MVRIIIFLGEGIVFFIGRHKGRHSVHILLQCRRIQEAFASPVNPSSYYPAVLLRTTGLSGKHHHNFLLAPYSVCCWLTSSFWLTWTPGMRIQGEALASERWVWLQLPSGHTEDGLSRLHFVGRGFAIWKPSRQSLFP